MRYKKAIKAIALIMLVIAIMLGAFEIYAYINISKICDLIDEGNTQSAIQRIEYTPNVNRYSAPLWMRNLIAIMFERDIELPLVVACKEGNTAVVRVLLEKNADPNQYLMGNWSPMEAAIIGRSKERFQIVQMLQEKGADVNLFGSRQSALFEELQALMFKKDPTPQDLELSREIITFFITNGASTAGNRGNTMLHYLSYTGDLSLLDAFYPECAQYVNIQDNQGETPLMWAISGKKTDAVRWLLDKGADRNIVDANGKTAYDHAVENGYLEIAEILKNE